MHGPVISAAPGNRWIPTGSCWVLTSPSTNTSYLSLGLLQNCCVSTPSRSFGPVLPSHACVGSSPARRNVNATGCYGTIPVHAIAEIALLLFMRGDAPEGGARGEPERAVPAGPIR
jgi:hypothetical protein